MRPVLGDAVHGTSGGTRRVVGGRARQDAQPPFRIDVDPPLEHVVPVGERFLRDANKSVLALTHKAEIELQFTLFLQ